MDARTSSGGNRLATERSPYLLQHADNPVDWYPWGLDAFALARKRDQPVLLSVGYFTCHWCHVMERESFRNPDIARLMNEHFVNIKVDREERPDVDEIYMAVTVALCGHGGWPMTVFLTPDAKPFFAGTYFPPEDRLGLPGFVRILGTISDLWKSDRNRVVTESARIVSRLEQLLQPSESSTVDPALIQRAIDQLARAFDPEHGGFGKAPKFPPHAALRLLAAQADERRNATALRMLTTTLDGMQRGGIHDQLGGGFARYSTDATWHVPHFEKMLVDNAQLVCAYLTGLQLTSQGAFRDAALGICAWVAREMLDSGGGFHTALDADSEGQEGRFYVFESEEIDRALLPLEADAARVAFDVSESGNWNGTNVLWSPLGPADCAKMLGCTETEFLQRLASARPKLEQVRGRRVRPATDDKVITAHTALMASALARASLVLDIPSYLALAERAVRFVLEHMCREDARLYRVARAGVAGQSALLEDYAALANAEIDLYEVSGDADWLRFGKATLDRMVDEFRDLDSGRFFHTPRLHETLILRFSEGHDGATPNPTMLAARALGRLSWHLDQPDYRAIARRAIAWHGQAITRNPRVHCDALLAAQMVDIPPTTLVFVAGSDRSATRALWRETAQRVRPSWLLAPLFEPVGSSELPLFRGRSELMVSPCLYVCRGGTCLLPVREPEALAPALAELDSWKH